MLTLKRIFLLSFVLITLNYAGAMNLSIQDDKSDNKRKNEEIEENSYNKKLKQEPELSQAWQEIKRELEKNEDYKLHVAALSGNLQNLKDIFEKNKEKINQVAIKKGITPLFCAVALGNLDYIMFLIENGASVDAKLVNNANLLHIAVQCGHIQLVEFFLEKIDVNATMNDGCNVMHIAANLGFFEIAKILVKQNKELISSVNINDGLTPLLIVAGENRLEFVQWLLDIGADLMALTYKKLNVLHLAAFFDHKALIECVFDWIRNIQNKEKMEDFMQCLNYSDDKEQIKKSCKTLLLIKKYIMKHVPKPIFLLITRFLFKPEDVIEKMLTMGHVLGRRPMDFAANFECKKLLTPRNNNN